MKSRAYVSEIELDLRAEGFGLKAPPEAEVSAVAKHTGSLITLPSCPVTCHVRSRRLKSWLHSGG